MMTIGVSWVSQKGNSSRSRLETGRALNVSFLGLAAVQI